MNEINAALKGKRTNLVLLGIMGLMAYDQYAGGGSMDTAFVKDMLLPLAGIFFREGQKA